jgi:PilZ domain-containing protein
MKDRRKHKRYAADYQAGIKTKLLSTYELVDARIADGNQIHREGLSTILNISKGGCYIHCYAPFPLETRLLITISPPAFPNDKINVTGTIVRKEPCHNGGYYLAVQFIEYQEGSKVTMDKFIEFLTPKVDYELEQSDLVFKNRL